MQPPDMSYLTDIYFGWDRVARVPEILERLGGKRPLVITDRSLAGLGMVERLGLGQPQVFDRLETNPTEKNARAALEAYYQNSCDSIVALGGGSPIDLAKIVGLLASHPGPLEQYAILRGGVSRISGSLPPLVAVPTTAGSGSEVGRAALLTLESGDKLGFLSPHLLPGAAVCDPELTLSMPSALTAGSGMDALAHCVEAYLSPRWNPVAEAIALDGLERGFGSIRAAVNDGRDRPAREAMLLASLEAGLAFQKGLGAVHSLSHPLGALSDRRLHHGTLNGIFLPHVLEFNYSACPEKFERLAALLGAKSGSDLPELFADLLSELGLPMRLSELGLQAEDLTPLAEKAFRDHCTPTNPRPLTVEDSLELYLKAL